MGDESSKLTMVVGPTLNAIPYVGGALASAWSEWDTRRRFHRVEEVLRLLQDKLSRLTVNPTAADDAGMHLLELALSEAQLQHSERKRERLANVIVASWIADEAPHATFDESLLFLRATALFSESHIAVLNKLFEAGTDASVPFSDLKAIVEDPTNQGEATLILLNDLCSVFAFARRAWDLNKPDKRGSLLSTGNLSPEGLARNCFHAITDRGSKYVDFIIRGKA